jgi:endonuclease G
MIKNVRFLCALVFVALVGAGVGYAHSAEIDKTCPQFVTYGAPITTTKLNEKQDICYTGYALQYSYKTKTAIYVTEHLTKEVIGGPAKRKDDFRPDPNVPAKFQSQLADYAGQPFDRGHMVPAGDNTQSEKAMSDSFFLTNMVPQVPNNNRGIWKQLETAVRNYVLKGHDVYVVSGPIYSSVYQTIGNGVGVPTKLFKVVIDKQQHRAIAFVFPNIALPVQDLPKYATTIQDVEAQTGINFNPLLPKNDPLETKKSTLAEW